MPKELTHWMLAEKAAHRCEGSQVGRWIRQNPNLYLIGAVIPDTGFYSLLFPFSDVVKAAASRLHGVDGSDTFQALRDVLLAFQSDLSPGIWAFVLGVLSHIIADSTYHPWVIHHTGDTHHPCASERYRAVSRHREFETYLDLYCLLSNPWFDRRYVSGLVARKEMPRPRFLALVSVLYCGLSRPYNARICAAVRLHSVFQRGFFHKGLSGWFRARLGQGSGAVNPVASLFYPVAPPANLDWFGMRRPYQHPVSGQVLEESALDLEKKALDATVKWFGRIEEHVLGDAPLSVFEGLRGPCLETGIPEKGSVSAIRHLSKGDCIGAMRGPAPR